MWKVDKVKFDYCLQQFVESILDKQNAYDYRTTAIAFHTGYIYEQEWYKRLVWTKAQMVLDSDHWTEAEIGSGHILSRVNQTMNKRIEGQKNNMLNWRNAAALQTWFKNQPAESERIIYGIFKGANEQEAFEDAVALWGATYPVITYLFFLKDRHRFMPMRPHLFEERLKRLGFETECTRECTWEHFTEYMEIMKWIRKELMKQLDDSAELIDAHSLLSLMGGVEELEPSEDSREILGMSPFDTLVVTGPRGSRTKAYYLSRFEKEPENHEAAVSVHGLTCMACGFNFERTYGALGKNFIEVHHIRPLHTLDEEPVIDPVKDMVCLCSNCHRMIHRSKNSVMSMDELKQWLLWGPIWEKKN